MLFSSGFFYYYLKIVSICKWNDEAMYKKIIELKTANGELKIMLAVGGWNQGSLAFSNMASNERRRKNFVDKAVIFLRTFNFDGLGTFFNF